MRDHLYRCQFRHGEIVHLARHEQVKINQNIKPSLFDRLAIRFDGFEITALYQHDASFGTQREIYILLLDRIAWVVHHVDFKSRVALKPEHDFSEVSPNARLGREK